MQKRTTKVNTLKVISLSYSSIGEIGDAKIAKPKSRAIAVQKEGADFQENLFQFSDYAIFQKQIDSQPGVPPVHQKHYHHVPYIHINNIEVTGASSSSLIQLGSLDKVDAESRLKHIRILQDENETI